MLVGEARAVAARWVAENAPDCRGAFLTGSTTVLPLDDPLPRTFVAWAEVLTGSCCVPAPATPVQRVPRPG